MGEESGRRGVLSVMGAGHGAGTVVLIEVPVMLMLVRICLKTRRWFPEEAKK